jgi:gliding motility-associated-like protein
MRQKNTTNMFKRKIFLLATLLPFFLLAQGDECSTATWINNVNNWCSNIGEYSNVTATNSGLTGTTCGVPIVHDVWFRFVATGQDVIISIRGAVPNPPSGGTIRRPGVELLYTTTCTNWTILDCGNDNAGFNEIQIYRGGLTVGSTYYIRVDALYPGTFQLCINNYTAPSLPTSDCPQAAILCDKSPFFVSNITGVGNIPDEANGTCLDLGPQDESENASTWYQWVCDVSGPLTFNINPSFPSDDIDFVLYELPNGIGNCNGRAVLRCMASHESGSTGLNLTSTDVMETSGIDPSHDRYVSAINMVSGRAYALMINNFTSSGNGFSIDFGGTGTFLGPKPEFTIQPSGVICAGEQLNITENSTFQLGTITAWNWTFGGAGSSMTTSTIRGPHQVTYSESGVKPIILSVTSNLGCIVTKTLTVRVGKAEITAVTQQDNRCATDLNGIANVTAVNFTQGDPVRYIWSNGRTTSSISGLAPGNYTVTFTDGYCQDVETFNISSPPAYQIQSTPTLATCNGGQDGNIFLTVSGATPNYTYRWSNGRNVEDLTNVPIGPYTVTITDAMGCSAVNNYQVRELELLIDAQQLSIVDPSCYGFTNGSISIAINNGLAPYAYDWGNTGTFQSGPNANTITNIGDGQYVIRIRDANTCYGLDTFYLNEPDELLTDIDSVQITCFGDNDGQATASTTGGTMPYRYSWSDPNHQTTAHITQLPPGAIYVTVTDDHGCTVVDTSSIYEPPLLQIISATPNNALCFGVNNGSIDVVATGGSPYLSYGVDLNNMVRTTHLPNLFSNSYTVYVRDSLGCVASAPNVIIDQPFQIVVNAGPDQQIQLGESISLHATVNSFRGITYQWSPPDFLNCVTCRDVDGTPTHTITYDIVVTDQDGCTATDQVLIEVERFYPLFIPNAFTPNHDGHNDIFRAYSGAALQIVNRFAIFDRWGEMVFEATDVPLADAFGWNGIFAGKAMMPDVFVYLLEVTFIDGHQETYSGDVTLLK